jgi:asparagine N-glycosylation enzyme membrane subunit Stt3
MKEKSVAPLLFLIALLFLLALSVRVMGFQHQTLSWADPWLHYSVTKNDFIETHHYSPWNNLSNFPGTGKNWTPPGFYYIVLLPYMVMSNDTDHLIYFFEVWPILFGTSAVLLMYVLMKTAFNKRIGFLSGFFLAIVSAASIRSTSGVYRGDVFLVTVFLLALYVYYKIYTTPVLKSLKWITFEIGLLITSMLLFNGWILILLVLLSFSFFMSIYNTAKKVKTFNNSVIAFAVTVPAVSFLYCFNVLHDNVMPDFITKVSMVIVAGCAAILFTEIAGRLFIQKKYYFLAVLFCIPAGLFIVFYEKFSFLQGFLISRSAFFLPQTEVSRQIQELQPVTPSLYVSAFTSLLLMVVFGGILLLFSITKGRAAFRPKKPGIVSLCMVGVWVVFSVYMSVTLTRFIFTAAPGICAFSGMAFYYFFYSAERSIYSPLVRLLAKYSVIFLYVLVPMFGSFYIYSDTDTYITPAWEEASSWLHTSSGEDASILTEWDQSNWFQAISERYTVSDTIMAQRPQKAANFFCASPEKGLIHVRYRRIQYVAMDKRTLGRFYVMLPFAVNPVLYEKSTAYHLYFDECPGLELVFEYKDLKLFEVMYKEALVTNFSVTVSGDTLLLTVSTLNPTDEPVELKCVFSIKDMKSDVFSSRGINITAYPGHTTCDINLEMPPLYRFFIVLEEGDRAPLTRAVFLK